MFCNILLQEKAKQAANEAAIKKSELLAASGRKPSTKSPTGRPTLAPPSPSATAEIGRKKSAGGSNTLGKTRPGSTRGHNEHKLDNANADQTAEEADSLERLSPSQETFWPVSTLGHFKMALLAAY
ncbi:unnamed protein product [Protopolystoma xenopodis]|uniref:Uncharacterized protein n=1 Tax=Protopolystoma xenopodis TaxID=117903 RepID=A0A448WNN0_9PLAT|nr:unnamed protein product [Protopolystoma xenopodis]